MKEIEIINKVEDMCCESLSPEKYEMWETVKLWLCKTRKELKSTQQPLSDTRKTDER